MIRRAAALILCVLLALSWCGGLYASSLLSAAVFGSPVQSSAGLGTKPLVFSKPGGSATTLLAVKSSDLGLGGGCPDDMTGAVWQDAKWDDPKLDLLLRELPTLNSAGVRADRGALDVEPKDAVALYGDDIDLSVRRDIPEYLISLPEQPSAGYQFAFGSTVFHPILRCGDWTEPKRRRQAPRLLGMPV